jgi:hypothetical protein
LPPQRILQVHEVASIEDGHGGSSIPEATGAGTPIAVPKRNAELSVSTFTMRGDVQEVNIVRNSTISSVQIVGPETFVKAHKSEVDARSNQYTGKKRGTAVRVPEPPVEKALQPRTIKFC